jgi:RNA polymerase sigma factor (sigma-70 family)
VRIRYGCNFRGNHALDEERTGVEQCAIASRRRRGMSSETRFGYDEEIERLADLAVDIALERLPLEEAGEVGQATIAVYLHRLKHGLKTLGPVNNPEAYVTRVTCNLIIRLWEERKRCVPTDQLLEVADHTQADQFSQILDRIVADAVWEEIDRDLTVRQRKILKLRYVDGKSREEVGEDLNISIETVKSNLRDIKRKVKQKIDPGDGRESGE